MTAAAAFTGKGIYAYELFNENQSAVPNVSAAEGSALTVTGSVEKVTTPTKANKTHLVFTTPPQNPENMTLCMSKGGVILIVWLQLKTAAPEIGG